MVAAERPPPFVARITWIHDQGTQPWRWIVISDPAKRQAISDALSAHLASDEGMRSYFESGVRSEDRSQRLMLTGALEITRDLSCAPVLIIPCVYGVGRADNLLAGSSIYAAVQNMLLAARGLDLGTVLTTFQAPIESTVRELLQIPERARPAALVPLGLPDANFETLLPTGRDQRWRQARA